MSEEQPTWQTRANQVSYALMNFASLNWGYHGITKAQDMEQPVTDDLTGAVLNWVGVEGEDINGWQSALFIIAGLPFLYETAMWTTKMLAR